MNNTDVIIDIENPKDNDLISRQAVLDCLTATGLKKYDFILNARIKIKALPPVTQKPKTGYWIDIDDIVSECSECGHREPNERFIFEDINFCAKCGAKMQEV